MTEPNEKLKLLLSLSNGEKELTASICLKMLEALSVPEKVVKHVKAVRDKALELGGSLNEKGLGLDLKLIENSALLHDICRTEKNHAAAGAMLIDSLGFKREADIIRQHHELETEALDEAAVVYLADKLIKEDRPVSLEERFKISENKCITPEAKEAHLRRFRQAKEVLKRVQSVLNK